MISRFTTRSFASVILVALLASQSSASPPTSIPYAANPQSQSETQSQAAAPVAPTAQSSTGQQQSSPSAIRSTTRLVKLSVIVKDKQGNPVTNLTSADFAIRDQNKPQKLRFFLVESSDPPTAPAVTLPPDTYSNRPSELGHVPPSVTMILFDGLNTALVDQAYARAQVIKFLKQVQPQDHVALYALGRQLSVIHDFTTDSSRLVASLDKSTPQTAGDLDASTPQDVESGDVNVDSLLQNMFQHEANFYIEDRVNVTVQALMAIADHVSPLPGRKNLIWVSGSFPFSVGYENVDDLLANLNNPSHEQILFADDVEKAARALNDANIAVYPVDARGLLAPDMGTSKNSNRLPGQSPSPMNTANGNNGGISPGAGGGRGPGGGGGSRGGGGGGMRSSPHTNGSAANVRPSSPIKSPDTTLFETMTTMADRTGGKAFYNSNDIFGAVRQAVDDSKLTYEIGYYPEDVKWDGSFHEVQVTVNRPDVQVRARKGYFALPDPKTTQDSAHDAFRFAADSPIDPSEIGVLVHASVPGGPQSREVSLAVRFDMHAIDFQQVDSKWNATLNVAVLQRDRDGKVITGTEDTFALNLSNEQYQRALREGLTFPKNLTADPGAFDVRVILRDSSSGHLGALTVPLSPYFRDIARPH